MSHSHEQSLVPGLFLGMRLCVSRRNHYLSVSLSLLLKVCQTLKNRARNVRDIARDTLVKMAAALGPRYLPYIIREMKELLTRGYQVSGRILGGWEGGRVRGEGGRVGVRNFRGWVGECGRVRGDT